MYTYIHVYTVVAAADTQQKHRDVTNALLWKYKWWYTGAVAAVSVALACLNPSWAMYMSFPCLLAATLEGTLIGSLLPAPANRILHPIIVTCLVINAAAAVFGFATGVGYQQALHSYLTKVLCCCCLQASNKSNCALVLNCCECWQSGL